MNFTTSFSHTVDILNNSDLFAPEERKQLVLLGDKGSGKTSLLRAFTQISSSLEYVPKILEHFVVDVKLPDKEIELTLWNTAGQENFDRLCGLFYPDADVIVLCFSFDKPESLESVVKKWYPELRKISKNIPVVLVGNKTDLRHDFRVFKELQKVKKVAVRSSEGRTVAEMIKAFCYLECSAKNNIGVTEVFQNAIRAIVKHKKSRIRSRKLFLKKG